jgi:hypothetical protein
MQIGTQATGVEFFTGSIGELVFLEFAPYTSARQALERNQGAFYGVTVA